jgi:PilZ domain-containing protein
MSVIADQALGVLGKEVAVRLLNGSPSGCLVETNAPLEIGTIASLRVRLNGNEFVDDVRVVRCQQIEGAGSVFHVGAQFLWTAMPSGTSLRQLMSRALASMRASPGPKAAL